MGNKRALSGVVTTLIIILLVIVAVGIVWAVVGNMISEGAEEISLGKFTINFEIEKVTVAENSVDVKVKRNPGEGEISGINFIISDGVNSEVFEKPTTIQQLGEQTFTLDYSGLIKEISIVPVFKSESGKEQVGNEVDKFETNFIGLDVLKNYGLVSWWRFEENAEDEIGNNHGTKYGGVDCNVEGKFGKACNFDGVDDYVNVGSIPLGDSWAISSWFKYPLATTINPWHTLIRGISSHHIILRKSDVHLGTYVSSGFKDSGFDMSTLTNGWHHLIVIGSEGNTLFYIDGKHKGTIIGQQATDNIVAIGNYQGGGQQFGITDEPMIFNRALTENEIQELYKSNLN